MGCFLKIVLEALSRIVAPCIKAFREGGEKVRGLQARAETAEKKCSELEQKNHASESEIRSLRQEVATERAAKHFEAGILVFLMVSYRVSPFLVGLVLGILYSSLLLRLSSNLEQYVRQGLRLSTGLWQSAGRLIRLVFSHLVQLAERIHRRIRDWKWKSVPVSRSFTTTP